MTFLSVTKQLYEWFSPPARPSARLLVRQTFLNDVPITV